MRFQSITKFNIALLAKQGWHLIIYLNSLLARILKSKVFSIYIFFKCKVRKSTFVYLKKCLGYAGTTIEGFGLERGMG